MENAENVVVQRMSPHLLKAERESMSELAHRFPRQMARVCDGLVQDIQDDQEYAASMLYSIPYKSKGQEVRVEGLSIGAAMLILQHMGNMSVGARIVEEDENNVDVEAICVDHEQNRSIQIPFRVSKWLKLHSGQVVRLDERRTNMAVQAGVSKAVRNSVLKMAPVRVVRLVEAHVRKAMAAHPVAGTPPKKMSQKEALVRGWQSLGVTEEMLVKKWGNLSRLTPEKKAEIRASFNAIRDGETQASDVFGTPPPQKKEESVSVDEVLNAGVESSEDDVKPQGPVVEAEPEPGSMADPGAPLVSDDLLADLLAELETLEGEEAWKGWLDSRVKSLAKLGTQARKLVENTHASLGKRRGWKR